MSIKEYQKPHSKHESRLYTLVSLYGLHVQPAVCLVQVASQYQELEIRVGIYHKSKESYANAKSIMDVITLAASRGTILEIVVTGDACARKAFYHAIESLDDHLLERYMLNKP